MSEPEITSEWIEYHDIEIRADERAKALKEIEKQLPFRIGTVTQLSLAENNVLNEVRTILEGMKK